MSDTEVTQTVFIHRQSIDITVLKKALISLYFNTPTKLKPSNVCALT